MFVRKLVVFAENEEKIIRYYVSKPAYPQNSKTLEFLNKGYGQKESASGYTSVIKAFRGTGGEANEIAYYGFIQDYLAQRKNNEQTEFTKRLCLLNEMTDDEILCHGDGRPDQKWHFLISWYAYKKLLLGEKDGDGNRVFCDASKTKAAGTPEFYEFFCKELIIWLAEVITADKPEFEETAEAIYRNAVNNKENGEEWNYQSHLDKIFNTVIEIQNSHGV